MVPSPGHRDHRRSVNTTVHPGCGRFDEHPDRAAVQAAPPAHSLTTVIPRRPDMALAAPAPGSTARTCPHHHCGDLASVVAVGLLELDVFNHGALVDTQQRTPYPHLAHVVVGFLRY